MEAAEAAETALEAGETLDERAEAYRQYRQRFERARAAVALVHIALVGKAARGGATVKETTRRYRDESGELVTETEREYARPEWKASQWLLSRSFPADLGDRRALEVSGPDGRPIEHAAGPADEALRTIADRLAEVAALQREQAPGGWDVPALAAGPSERLDVDQVADAELVDDVPEQAPPRHVTESDGGAYGPG